MRQSVLALVVGLFLTACVSESTATPTVIPASDTPSPTLIYTPEPSSTPTKEPTPTEEVTKLPEEESIHTPEIPDQDGYYTEYRNGVQVKVDPETGKIVEYYDEEKGAWKSASFEVSQRFPAGFIEKYVADVEGIDFPINIGIYNNVITRDKYAISEIHIAPDIVELLGDYFMHAFHYRYKELMGNDVTYEEYLELVRQGKGQVEIAALNEVTGKNQNDVEVQTVDPREGVAMTFTDNRTGKPLPIDYKDMWKAYVGVDGGGKLLLATDLFSSDSLSKNYKPIYGQETDDESLMIVTLQPLVVLVGQAPNNCILAGNLTGGECRNYTTTEEMRGYVQPIIDEWRNRYKNGGEPMFTIVRPYDW